MESLRRFFEVNTVLVFFTYGQVFFVLGLAIALQSRRHSRLELARILGWLAAFGISHGLHEWGQLFIPIQSSYMPEAVISFLRVIEIILLALSFTFLFQFGAEALRDRWPRLTAAPILIMLGWSLVFVMPGLVLNPTLEGWHQQSSIWARYVIGFPAAVVAAAGLRYQAQRRIKPLAPGSIYTTLQIAGIGLVAYALLSGLIVDPGDFFPANWLNTERFLAWIGIPVEVFRSLVGLILAITIIRGLEVFQVEVDRSIEKIEAERNLSSERDRIGRELHDGSIQSVYTAGLLVESARRRLPAEDEAGHKLDRAMTVLNEAIASLRSYIGQLRPGPLDISLVEGLRQQASDPGLTTLMSVDLELDLPAEESVSPLRTAHMLAIVSEALSNAARHANARRVVLRADREGKQFTLLVEDDGQGFSPDNVEAGYGLRNMRDRARLLGGELVIDSEPGRGTRVTLTAPWEETG
ncbi:MAG: histidine kinase [Anaerolineae bacterium]|nr:MAG: histidine kinase [Anaerolineae bacterium]